MNTPKLEWITEDQGLTIACFGARIVGEIRGKKYRVLDLYEAFWGDRPLGKFRSPAPARREIEQAFATAYDAKLIEQEPYAL